MPLNKETKPKMLNFLFSIREDMGRIKIYVGKFIINLEVSLFISWSNISSYIGFKLVLYFYQGIKISDRLVCFGFLFNGILFVDYFMLNHPCRRTTEVLFKSGDKDVLTFLNGICPKVNVIARLEFELAYFQAAQSSTLTIAHLLYNNTRSTQWGSNSEFYNKWSAWPVFTLVPDK